MTAKSRCRAAAAAAILLAHLCSPALSPASALLTVVGGGDGNAVTGANPLKISIWTHSVRLDAAGRLHLTTYDQFGENEEKEGFLRIGTDGRVDRSLRTFDCCVDDLWVDPRGEVYLTTQATVVRTATDGTSTVFAGSGVLTPALLEENPAAPGDGGPATLARFASSIQGIVIDRDGHVYLSDYAADVVRRVNGRTGVITRVAGRYFQRGYAGDGGPAVEALLNEPHKLAIDRDGSLLVCDKGNSCIRKVDLRTGVISTLAGKPGETTLYAPLGIDADQWGNVYVADYLPRIVRISPDGPVAGVAGSEWGLRDNAENATRGQMFAATGVVVDPDGHLYVADYQRAGWSTVKRVLFDPLVTGVSRAVSGGRETITINGRYFSTGGPPGSVLLDGRPLAVVSWSNTSVVADLPPGPAGRMLEVITAGGRARLTLD